MKILHLLSTLLTTAAQITHHTASRIIGGTATDPTRYSYLVSLQTTQHFCGATIIAPDVILTAAHCTIFDYDDVTIQIGGYTVDGEESSGERVDVVKARRIYVHPQYDSNINSNDFALIILERPTVAGVQYVRLNDDHLLEMNTLTALGWGDTTPEDGYDFSNVLREVQVDYVENGVCDASTDGVDSYEGMIFEEMICASAAEKDGCQGDSGK
jgi:trypsin